MKLYHVTKREHLSSILKKGLIPYHRKGITCNIPKSHIQQPRVWLTDNIDIPKVQLGNLWDEKSWVVLEVNTSDLDVFPHMTTCYPDGLNKPISGEYVVFGIIPPTKISQVDFMNTESHAVMASIGA